MDVAEATPRPMVATLMVPLDDLTLGRLAELVRSAYAMGADDDTNVFRAFDDPSTDTIYTDGIEVIIPVTDAKSTFLDYDRVEL